MNTQGSILKSTNNWQTMPRNFIGLNLDKPYSEKQNT